MTELNVIPLRNNVLLDFKYQEIKTKILNRLNELNLDINKYRNDIEFLTLICNLVEHIVQKSDKINKFNLVLSILLHHFELTEIEIDLLKKNIEYIHSNKNIKKISFYRLFKTSVSEWFKKKN